MKTAEDYRFRVRWIVLVVVAALMVLWRLGQGTGHVPLANFTSIGAMALFAGAYFRQSRQAYALPLLVLLGGDFLMSQTIYASYNTGFLYRDWWWTYIAFGLMVLVGGGLIRRFIVWRIVVSGLGAALVHWLVANIGPCFFGGTDILGVPYTHDLGGVLRCYGAGIPWSARLLYGTWVYSVLFFGGYALWIRYVPALSKQRL